jgi:cytidylate kinase
MAIITISRELAALGDETALELANQLNYRLVDKFALEERIKSYGVDGTKFQKYDEKKPSFLASMSRDRDDYLHFLRSAILAEAAQGKAVLMGRGAAMILKNVPGVFSVFLVAPPAIRLERVKSFFHCDDKRAQQIIEQSDRDRQGFHRYFFDTAWKDSGNYHLSLNTGALGPEVCAEIIKHTLERIMTEDTEARSAQGIRELSLAQAIKHAIVYEKEMPVHFLEVSVSGGKVYLYGVASAQPLIEAALATAKEMAPDFSVESEIQVVRDYSVQITA